METPSFKEDHISQIPALQMLMNLGYTYLSPAEAGQFPGLLINSQMQDTAIPLILQNKKINCL